MNYYPGEGLGIHTAILGNTVGQAYPTGTVFTLCKIYGVLLTAAGDPVGKSGTSLLNTSTGTTVVPTWIGVQVTGRLASSTNHANSIISTDTITVTTNEQGYFEFHVIQGLVVEISSQSFGKFVSVDTSGLLSIDISTLF